MRGVILLASVAVAGCTSDGVVGDACDANEDCEDQLVCIFDDPVDTDETGVCVTPAAAGRPPNQADDDSG